MSEYRRAGPTLSDKNVGELPMRFRAFVATVVALTFALLAANLAMTQTPVVAGGVRVMTYNIHHASGNDDCTDEETPEGEIPEPDCALDLERIAQVIESQSPDIVALQEVDRFWARSGGVDQPEALAEMLGMNVCYGANLSHEADDHADEPHEYGVAVLTIFDISSCENTLLPIVEGEEQRGLLDARITIDGVGEVAVLNTHFDHKESSTRQMQAEAVVDYLGNVDVPAVLMGDLNAGPDDGDLDVIQAQMTDAWEAAGDGTDGFTYPADPESSPENRIDYIFAGPGVTVQTAAVVDSDLAVMASDHLPVVADVQFQPVEDVPGATPVT
jgi:endonuclease/exonuclease/phosphatase family metal-dependent hydrolase